MGSAILRPGPRGFGLSSKRITLRIYPNNTGTPTWNAEGGVTTVARDSAGKFKVTLDEAYYKVTNCQATFQSSADNVDLVPQVGDFANCQHNGTTVGTAGQPVTFFVKLKTGATNTDVAAATQTCIFVVVEFEDQQVSS